MSSSFADDRGVIVACASCGQRNRLAYGQLADAVRCAKCKTEIPAPHEPVEIGEAADFHRLITAASLPVIVDFWAPWCGPCRTVAPELEKVAARHAGEWLVAKVNTDDLSSVGQQLGIRSIPTLAVFSGGREVARTTGARPASEIEAFVRHATSTTGPV